MLILELLICSFFDISKTIESIVCVEIVRVSKLFDNNWQFKLFEAFLYKKTLKTALSLLFVLWRNNKFNFVCLFYPIFYSFT